MAKIRVFTDRSALRTVRFRFCITLQNESRWLFMHLNDRVMHELEIGRSAVQSGNTGRARVCARRAIWFALSDVVPQTINAMQTLRHLAEILLSPLAERAECLCHGERHRQEGGSVSEDPLSDAEMIIAYCREHTELRQTLINRISSAVMRLLVYIAFAVSMTSSALSKGNPATWALTSLPKEARVGDTILLVVQATIEKGWHIYGIREYLTPDGIGPQRTEFTVATTAHRILSSRIRIAPPPQTEYDSAFEITVEKIKGTVRFTLPLVIGPVSAGNHRDTLRIYHQLCTNQNCLPPDEVALPFELHIHPSLHSQKDSARSEITLQQTERTPSPPPTSPTPASTVSVDVPRADEDSSPSSSWLGLIGLAIVLGIGSWLMPCVYPMIPITVSFFSKRAEKEHTRPVFDSAIYSLGIMSTFIVFGAVAAFFFGATAGRDIATNPWLNFFLALLFLVIAGNLFGMYELRLPSRLINALNRESVRTRGYRSSFLMGMVFSLTSFTCTVPFVDIIGKMAAGGEWFRPLTAMTLYAAVFALPFFGLALFPTAITRLPRSGIWMNHLKVSFAFIEIAFAVSYLARVDSILGWQILSRELVLATWASCTLLVALYILGLFRTKLDTPLEYVGGIRASIATAFIALTLYLVQGMFGGSVGPLEAFVYVESARPVATASDETLRSPTAAAIAPGQWTEDLDAALAHARTQGVPVFVDFTGVSCTNCRWMEKNMFTQPPVRSLMERMILVRAFTDRRNNPRDQHYKRYQQERFGSTLLPFYVLLSPNGSVIATATYTSDRDEFVAFLQKATSAQMTSNAQLP